MKLYKLTDRNNQTGHGYKLTTWGEGVTHETDGLGTLCGPGWIHAYTDPLLAVLHAPAHFNFPKMKLWECEGDGAFLDDNGLKCGSSRLTTLREIPLPEITTEQRIKYAILCAKEVCLDVRWNEWANAWLSGEDRSSESARRAANSPMDKWGGAATMAAVNASLAAMWESAPRSSAAAIWVTRDYWVNLASIAHKAMEE